MHVPARGLPNHESVKYSVSEYVNGQAHTNGVESFWAVLKRACHGVYHQLSPKHLQRYVNQFAGKHNVRHMDTPSTRWDMWRRLWSASVCCGAN